MADQFDILLKSTSTPVKCCYELEVGYVRTTSLLLHCFRLCVVLEVFKQGSSFNPHKRVPTTALDLKTFAGSYLPIDGSKHKEILMLFVSISDWFCLEISFFPSLMVLVYRNEYHFKFFLNFSDRR